MMVKPDSSDALPATMRAQVLALAHELGVSETRAILAALQKLDHNAAPAHPPDKGPLTAMQIAAIRKDAARFSPSGHPSSGTY